MSAAGSTSERLRRVALVGNPNAGKSTLFNALTGSLEKVGNYAGVTVASKTGSMRTPHGGKLEVVDLPGCYSLTPQAADEAVTRDALVGARPDLVVCVVDASHLERHLYLVTEVIDLGLPVVVALNMIDVAEAAGLRLDVAGLAAALGVPVIPCQANKGKGIVPLKHAMCQPVALGKQLRPGEQPSGASQARAAWVQEICATVVSRPGSENRTVSDKLDAVLIHGVWGWVTLIVLMLGVFWTIFSVAEVPMGWIESAIGWIEGLVENAMQPGDLRDLLTGGVIEGVGGVLVFLPQIALLFFFIALLESSGYMARAAYLMDAVMAKAGLSGKAFLPLLSSYACAIPGVLATRTIPSKKERLVTIFVAPWMSCSARLPVYLLLVPLLLSEQSTLTQAVVFFGIYAVGTGTAFLVARVLRGRLGPEAQPVAFHLELPPYRAPQWGYVFRHVGGRAFAFLRKAGTLIFGLSILLWAAKTYPKSDSDDKAVQLETSAMGHLGQFIAPIVKPLGFDARTGTAVLTSFAAREVFVASMAISYSVDDEEDHAKIRERLATARWPDGSPVYTPLMAVSLIVFFIFALQCLPTTAVVAREAGSWKWAIGQFVFMTGFAYLASLVVYQGGRLLGF